MWDAVAGGLEGGGEGVDEEGSVAEEVPGDFAGAVVLGWLSWGRGHEGEGQQGAGGDDGGPDAERDAEAVMVEEVADEEWAGASDDVFAGEDDPVGEGTPRGGEVFA